MYNCYRIYRHALYKYWQFGKMMFIIAEINWDYSHEFSMSHEYPDDWDALKKLGYKDHQDAAIHCWVKKYYPELHKWLTDRNIKWVGIQSGDSEKTAIGMRGFMVICVGLDNPDDITEFMLTWG